MCFVEPSEEVSKCSFSTCMENRRLAVRNNQPFTCKHLGSVKDRGSLNGYYHQNIVKQ